MNKDRICGENARHVFNKSVIKRGSTYGKLENKIINQRVLFLYWNDPAVDLYGQDYYYQFL